MSTARTARETVPANAEEPLMAPFSLVLAVPFVGRHHTDKENIPAKQALMELLQIASGEDEMAASQLGGLASGLVTGRIDRVSTSQPVGLYALAEGGRGITFMEPIILATDWENAENKVGPTYQSAMRTILETLTDTTIVDFRGDFPNDFTF